MIDDGDVSDVWNSMYSYSYSYQLSDGWFLVKPLCERAMELSGGVRSSGQVQGAARDFDAAVLEAYEKVAALDSLTAENSDVFVSLKQ